MTIRIPRAVVYVLGTLAFVGVSVAGYLVFHESARQCLTAAGSPVSCDAADSLSYSEYDVMKEQEEAAAEAEAAADECQQQTGGLQSSLEELDSRLTVGLAYDEYSTQVGDAQSRMAIDEMQHAVMRAAKAEIGEDRVRIAGEIAIGEEQELGEFEQLRL